MTELATTQSTELATYDNDDDYAGLTPTITRIAFPGAGGTAFTLPDETVVQSIEGVVVYNHATATLWLTEMGKSTVGDGSPVAYSNNGTDQTVTENGRDVLKELNAQRKKAGKELLPEPGTKLLLCPYNQNGSKKRYIDSDAHPFATATQHKRVLYVVRVGNTVPEILTLPFKSIKPWSNYAVGPARSNGGPSAVVTRIKLVKATNNTGAVYASAAFEFVSKLDGPDLLSAQAMKQLAREYANPMLSGLDDNGDAVAALANRFDADEIL